MKPIKWGVAAAVLAMMLNSVTMFAQDSGALIDALIKKGVITDQEGEEIRAEQMKDWSQTSASKINVSSFIKNITLYGDLRLRYENRNGTVNPGEFSSAGTTFAGQDDQTRNRWRYRLRAGIKGDLYDNFFFGLRLSTAGTNQRSGNDTFGSSGASPGANVQGNGGPFSHNNGVGWDQLYLGWKPTEWLTLTAGQMPNPFYTTNLIWDDNLSPTGFAEQFSQKIFKGTELFANAGQFLYNSSPYSNTATSPSSVNNTDVFMLEEQIGLKHTFNDDIYAKGAFGIMTYSGTQSGTTSAAGQSLPIGPGNQPTDFTGPFVGASTFSNNYGVNNLAVVEVPFEVGFKAWIPMKVFGDFAYNLTGTERADAAKSAVQNAIASGGTASQAANFATVPANVAALKGPTYGGLLGDTGDENKAYQIGLQFNDLKKKGDWMAKTYWEHTEYFAVDPNLNDADIFDARTNMEGIVVKGSYNFTDAITGTLQFGNANRINKNLGAPGTGEDLNIEPNNYRIVQADVVWKF
jgi:hypothetical protein